MKKSEWIESGGIITLSEGRYLVGWGKKEWRENHDEDHHPCFFFPDFFLIDRKPWLFFEHVKEVSLSDLQQLFNSKERVSLPFTPPDKKEFEISFQELRKHFEKKTLKKGVPYVFEKSPEKITPEKRFSILAHLIEYASAFPGFLYGFWGDDEGMIGASPEILFETESADLLRTVACAGTLGEHQSEEDFFHDPKERHEHQLVIEGIKESLAPFGKVEQGDMQLLKLSRLTHLFTPIELKLNVSHSYEAFVKALHPTPALGAFPKPEGMAWLMKMQSRIERGRYGAPAGYVNKNQQGCYVAIRNLQYDSRGCRIGAGCGVVPESRLEREWQEVHRKIGAIKGMLGL